jgi:hypothetical protein
MALKPYHQIAGTPAQPQFLLKDRHGREFGVVEHYETDRAKPTGFVLLEFFSPDPSLKGRPLVWVDLTHWTVVLGRGRNLPDEDFEAGLDAYLQGFAQPERDLRTERARKAHLHEVIALAGQGYTIAYQEIFPQGLKREDFPSVEMGGRAYLVDDQYNIQPGDFRNQVTLVFVEDREDAGGGPGAVPSGAPKEASLIANWLFGEGYEIVRADLDEETCHASIRALVENPELEKIYKERLLKMRREGTLLGVKPKPYTPTTPTTPTSAAP